MGVISNSIRILIIATVLLGLYLTSLYNYLLFHSLAEIFSITVGFSIFIIAWNSRRFLDNNYFLSIGIAYLFVSGLDLLHTLSYTGMGIFPEHGANLATQLWIGARYFESIALLVAPFLLGKRLHPSIMFLSYGVATSLLLGTIFYWDVFPTSFITGVGLTAFKVNSEYAISLILAGSLIILFQRRRQIDSDVLKLLAVSIGVTIASELSFTLYASAYGLPNLIGHFLKIISFYLIYRAVVETGLVRPYSLLFRNLKHSEGQFRDLYEEAPNALFSIGVDGRIQRANQRATELLGYDLNHLIGRQVFDLYADTPSGKTRAQEVFERFRSGQEIVNEELEMRRADGGSVWISLSVRPMRDRDGKVLYSRSAVVDITERKQAQDIVQQQKELLENALGSLGYPFYVVDINDRSIVIANSAAWQYPAEGDIRCYTITHGNREPCSGDEHPCPIPAVKATKKPVTVEHVHCDSYGNNRDIEVHGHPIFDKDGNVTSIIEYCLDITERKRTDQIKDDFIGLVSHELRSPLTVVTVAVNTVLTEREHLSPEEIERLLQDASSETETLAHLLGNLVELSRAQADRLVLQNEEISTDKVIHDIIGKIDHQSSVHQFVVDIPADLPRVYADQLRLERILRNFIDNAMKYSPEGGEIRIFVRKEEEHLVIGISDQGIGITATDQIRLFAPFQRIEDARIEAIGGLGLGLLVCRRLVEAHGGRVWVESEVNLGSTFFFTLPFGDS